MKKMFAILLLAGLSLMNTACISPSGVNAGEEGVITYKPWIFGHGGVDPEPIATGLVWTVWSTDFCE